MRRDDICLHVSPANHARLDAIIKDRNSSRKAVWRAEVVLATAAGHGTNEVMRLVIANAGISEAADFTDGSSFHRILWDDAQKGNSTQKLKADDKIKRVVICSGKVYFDLLAERDKRGQDDTYLLRLEQFYPFPAMAMTKELDRFKGAEIIWCQEEPMNQGAWYSSQHHMRHAVQELYGRDMYLDYVGREASAAPAGGYMSAHIEEEKRFVNKALTV